MPPTIRFACPCGHQLEVSSELAGTLRRCAHCMQDVRVPAAPYDGPRLLGSLASAVAFGLVGALLARRLHAVDLGVSDLFRAHPFLVTGTLLCMLIAAGGVLSAVEALRRRAL